MRSNNDEGIVMLETQSIRVKEINQVRAISCIFALLSYLQDEPFCGECSSFAKIFEKAMEKFLSIEKIVGRTRGMPEEARKVVLHIYNVLSDLKLPDNPVRQKKEGYCGFPPGICLAKNAFAMFEQIEEQTENRMERRGGI